MKQKYFLIYLVLVLFLIPLYGIDVPLSIVDTISFGDPSLSTVQHLGANRYLSSSTYSMSLFACDGDSIDILDTVVSANSFYVCQAPIAQDNRIYAVCDNAKILIYDIIGDSIVPVAEISTQEIGGRTSHYRGLKVFGNKLVLIIEYILDRPTEPNPLYSETSLYYQVYDITELNNPQLLCSRDLPVVNKHITDFLFDGGQYYLILSDGRLYSGPAPESIAELNLLPFYPEGEFVLNALFRDGRLTLTTSSEFGANLVHCVESDEGPWEVQLMQSLPFDVPQDILVQDDRVILTGTNFDIYNYEIIAFTPCDTEWSMDLHVTAPYFRIVPYGDEYLGCGLDNLSRLDSNLVTQALIYQYPPYNFRDLILQRYAVLQDMNTRQYRIFDLETETWLPGFFESYLSIPPRYNNNQLIFKQQGNAFQLVTLDDNGSYLLNSFTLPQSAYLRDAYGNRVLATEAGTIKIYEINGTELSEIASLELMSSPNTVVFYSADHIAASGYYDNEGIIGQLFRINNEGSLTQILYSPLNSVGEYYVCEDRLLRRSEGREIFDISDPDDPSFAGNLDAALGDMPLISFDGEDRYLFNNNGRHYITDADFGFLGSFVGGKVVYQGRNRILASDANSMILFEHPEEIASHDVHSPSAPDIIRAVYPNPFRDGLKLELSPKESGPLKVDIYNIKGQKVRTLHDAFARNTDLSLFWDARDSSGQTVSSGLYFVRAKSRAGQEVRRAILIKP